MLEARNIWDLVVARADATPDREMAVDEDGRRMTFGEYRDRCERTAAGLARLGVGEGTPVSWIQPTTLEAMVLFGALRRLGAVQTPILPIYREREVGFIVRQTGARLLVTPSTWRDFDYAAMARGVVEGTGTEVLEVDRELPADDPADLPPPPTTTCVPTGQPVRPVRLLHLGDGRAQGHRHGDRSLRAASVGMSSGWAWPRTTASPSSSRSPTSPAASTSTAARLRDLNARRCSTPSARSTAAPGADHPGAAGVLPGPTWRPSASSPGEAVPASDVPGGGKPPSLHLNRSPASASCRATGWPGPDPDHEPPGRPRRVLAATEGRQ